MLEQGAPHEDEPILVQMARELWRADYDELFAAEHAANLELLGPGYRVQPSSYAQRLTGQRLADYRRRMMNKERDLMAAALHGANMRAWTPSILARSVAYFSSASTYTLSPKMHAAPCYSQHPQIPLHIFPEVVGGGSCCSCLGRATLL